VVDSYEAKLIGEPCLHPLNALRGFKAHCPDIKCNFWEGSLWPAARKTGPWRCCCSCSWRRLEGDYGPRYFRPCKAHKWL